MKLSRATDEEKYNVCRKYYLGSFFFLPWLAIVNGVWFWGEAFKPGADVRIRKMVIVSWIWGIVGISAIAIWAWWFQAIGRESMGAAGDGLSAVSPKGYA